MREIDYIVMPLRHNECEKIHFHILQRRCRSAWEIGVTKTAIELLQRLDANFKKEAVASRGALKSALLNGADSWNEYSTGGCALIYDCDIAKRYCTPSELKKTGGGERAPNSHETWLDVQARALPQAAWMILNAADAAGLFKKEGEKQ